MRDSAERYNPLCQSLGISGFNRFRIIELKALRKPISQALAFACVISIGDFGVVALFGNDNFRTLPYYLYQQIGLTGQTMGLLRPCYYYYFAFAYLA